MCVCVRAYVYDVMEGGEGTGGFRARRGEREVCGRAWETTRKDKKTFLVGIELMTWGWAPVVLTTAPPPHTYFSLPYLHHITHTHTPAYTRTHTSIHRHTRKRLSTHALTR